MGPTPPIHISIKTIRLTLGTILGAFLILACNAMTNLGAEQVEVLTAPAAPSALAATLTANSQVQLTWADNSDNEDGFTVRRALADSGDMGVVLGRTSADGTIYGDANVSCETAYTYFVSAFNVAGVSTELCLRVQVPSNCSDPTQPLTTSACDDNDLIPTLTLQPSPTVAVGNSNNAPSSGNNGNSQQAQPTATTSTVNPTATSSVNPTGTATSGQSPTATPTTQAAPVCGDNDCNGSEDSSSCPQDCPVSCGDGVCDSNEGPDSCEADCPAVCGDGLCTHSEDGLSCDVDCGLVVPICGDGFCDIFEDSLSCPQDCITTLDVCGDGICGPNEDEVSCSSDCQQAFVPVCGDTYCDPGEDQINCPEDCAVVFGIVCGDGMCTGNESNSTCPVDCPNTFDVCGDGICTGFEDEINCSVDCFGLSGDG